MDSPPLRQLLSDVAHQLKRNKALTPTEGYLAAAVDGHEFFSSRKRCCPQCQTRILTVDGEEVTEYYHQGVVCQLIGQELALVLDVELLRPGEGEETAAKRLLERVFAHYPRYFDIVVGDALYFDAPFINSCLDHHKHVIVTAKGEHRLLVQDAGGLFASQEPSRFVAEKGRRTVRSWDEEEFTSCAGVKSPLRVMSTVETVRRRERIGARWQETEETTKWSWATTLKKAELSPRGLWQFGHRRWGVENNGFNVLSAHWGLDHCFKHAAAAIVNFLLTSFVVYGLLQSFYQRNLKPSAEKPRTLIGLAAELHRGVSEGPAPWTGLLARGP
jgi:hypothetical protein